MRGNAQITQNTQTSLSLFHFLSLSYNTTGFQQESDPELGLRDKLKYLEL